MESKSFVYWLQGFFELSKETTLTEEQVQIIKNHLALVFKHEIDFPDPTGELQAIHDGKPPKLPSGAPQKIDTLYRC